MNEELTTVKPAARIWKVVAVSLLVLLGLVLVTLATTNPRKMWKIYTFFDEDRRIENFRHLERIFPAKKIRRSGPKYEFERTTFTRGRPIRFIVRG